MSISSAMAAIHSSDLYALVPDAAPRASEQQAHFDNAMGLPTWERAKALYEDYAHEVLALLTQSGIANPTAAELLRFIGAFAWELYEAELDQVKCEADEETRRYTAAQSNNGEPF